MDALQTQHVGVSGASIARVLGQLEVLREGAGNLRPNPNPKSLKNCSNPNPNPNTKALALGDLRGEMGDDMEANLYRVKKAGMRMMLPNPDPNAHPNPHPNPESNPSPNPNRTPDPRCIHHVWP